MIWGISVKFEFWTTPGFSHLKAVFEESDSRVGKRAEGLGTDITLIDDTVIFDYEAKEIHPDILGLLCLVTFYPFVGHEVEFPKPVSSRLFDAFQNKCFTKEKNIKFRNISDDVALYEGEKVALSFGGGIDSSAITSVVYHDLEKKDIHTFSAIYGKNEWADESDFIDTYKSTLNNMHFISPSAESFYSDFENFITAQGEPVSSIGPYAQYKVMELAKGNVTVTLDGQGADEQLAGYHYFFGSYFKELLTSFKLFRFFKEVIYMIFIGSFMT